MRPSSSRQDSTFRNLQYSTYLERQGDLVSYLSPLTPIESPQFPPYLPSYFMSLPDPPSRSGATGDSQISSLELGISLGSPKLLAP